MKTYFKHRYDSLIQQSHSSVYSFNTKGSAKSKLECYGHNSPILPSVTQEEQPSKMARGSPTTSSSIRSKESTVGDDSHGERFSDALEHIPDTSDETTDERLEGLSSSSKNADDGLLQTGKSFLSRCWKRVISDQHDFSIYIRLLIVVFHLVELTGRMVLPVMNFAVTIFGLGVGVGLILGNHGHNHIATRPLDASLISSAQSPAAIAIQETTYTTIQTSTSSPSCRSTLRRVVAQVQEAPSVSRGALDMPAQ